MRVSYLLKLSFVSRLFATCVPADYKRRQGKQILYCLHLTRFYLVGVPMYSSIIPENIYYLTVNKYFCGLRQFKPYLYDDHGILILGKNSEANLHCITLELKDMNPVLPTYFRILW